jgi:putative flippase GtrA
LPENDRTKGPPVGVKENAAEVARFALIGIVSTLTYGASMLGFLQFTTINAIVANPLASLIAFIVSFMGHRYFTFRTGANWWAELGKFTPVALAQLVASQSIVTVTTLENWNPMIATVVVMFVIPISSYIVNKLWVFRYGKR